MYKIYIFRYICKEVSIHSFFMPFFRNRPILPTCPPPYSQHRNDQCSMVPLGKILGWLGCSFRVLGRARFWSCTPHSKRLFLCILNIVSYGFGNTRGQGPRLSIRPTGSSVFVFVRDVTHVQTCEKSASFFEFLGHTWNMSKPVMTFVFKVLRNRLLRYVFETCPNLWWRSCSKCYAYYTWLLRSKPYVFKVLNMSKCPNLWWRSCSKCYAIDCFGTYFKHVQTQVWWRSCSCSKCYAIDCFGTYCKHVQTCDDVRVQSATQSTASEHTSNMSQPVMTFMFKDHMFKIWVLGRVCSATL